MGLPNADTVDRLAEEFVVRCRQGENPSVEQYARRYPQLASQIRDLFPALVVLESVCHHDDASAQQEEQIPETIGEFQVLRLIGRGGMGVVYEALQPSLDRRVALKVLSPARRLDPDYIERFYREARATARLQHANIVPVIDVGRADGNVFIVMQLIDGVGLNRLMSDVDWIPGQEAGLSMTEPQAGDSTGPASRLGPTVRPPGSAASSSESRREPTAFASSGDAQRDLFSHVAEWGYQVADALAYAHTHSVLHRDIKPANLLIDAQGKAWVTDFGLAKILDDHDLTTSGDVVGTLRYIPPERLEGVDDPRGDVYSLGLTLYELVAGRPAFSEKRRAAVIHAIVDSDPPSLASINSRTPLDFETIIRKATRKNPDERYASAAEFSADLFRFVKGEPIRARRASRWQRWRLWSQRNPIASILAISLAALVIISTMGGACLTWWLGKAREETRSQTNRAHQAQVESNQRQRTVDYQKFEMQIAQARAARNGKVGQRRRALEFLNQAKTVVDPRRLSFQRLQTLRSEIISCMTLVDVDPLTTSLPGSAHDAGAEKAVWGPRRNRLARWRDRIQVRILEVDGNEIKTLRDPGRQGEPPVPPRERILDGQFDPTSRFFAALSNLGVLRVWRVSDGERVIHVPDVRTLRSYAIGPGGRLAVCCRSRQVKIFQLNTGRLIHQFNANGALIVLHPQGDKLAYTIRKAKGDEVVVYDIQAAAVETKMQLTHLIYSLAWDGQGELALGGESRISLCDERTGTVRAVLNAEEICVSLCYVSGGKLLASCHRDHVVLWDAAGDRRALEIPIKISGRLQRGHDQDQLMLHPQARVATQSWKIVRGHAVCSMRYSRPVPIRGMAMHRDGVLGATNFGDRIYLWTSKPGRGQVEIDVKGVCRQAWFQADGKALWTRGDGVRGWKITRSLDGGEYRLTPISDAPRSAAQAPLVDDRVRAILNRLGGTVAAGPTGRVAFSSHKQLLAVLQSPRAVTLIDVRNGETLGSLNASFKLHSLAFSPNGEDLMAGSVHGKVQTWHLRQIRDEFQRMEVDWALPEFGEPSKHHSSPEPLIRVSNSPATTD